MAGFVAYQPSPDATSCRLDIARARIEHAKGLDVENAGEHALKVMRRNGRGARPAANAHGWLVSAGTWHHPDLGTDDNEALLARLQERGAASLDELDGFFALAWSDARSGTLTVCPDHLGRLHVYCAEAPEGVYVGTSPVALAAAARCGPDPAGVWELLAGGTCYEDRSPFAGVRRLAGARRHLFRGGRSAGEETVERQLAPPRGPAEGAATAEDLLRTWKASLEAFLPRDLRLLPDLTGGRDSRLLVGLLLDLGYRFDVTVTGEPGDPEVRIAQRVARALGLVMHLVPDSHLERARASFDAVRRAAARVEGGYDAIEYAGIAAVHERNSASFDVSLNGSGGELARWYSWNTAGNRALGDPVRALLHRLAGGTVRPPFLLPEHCRDADAHFRDVILRAVRGREGDPIGSLLDHCYLHLRLQCWQGSLATATSELWLSLAPFLLRRPLATVYETPAADRFGSRLLERVFRALPAPLVRVPLASGYPPVAPRPWEAWRHLPGLARAPARLLGRVRGRLLRGRPDPGGAAAVRELMASGASDFLRPREMALAPLVDAERLEEFLERARTEGAVPSALLGRLIALEWALREAAGS